MGQNEMSERLRLALEQAIDAETEARNLADSTCLRADAAYTSRFLTRDALKRLRVCVMKNSDLILDNVDGAGIQAFDLQIHATLTELATQYDDDLPPEKDPDHAE
jgi:hypothetical protein